MRAFVLETLFLSAALAVAGCARSSGSTGAATKSAASCSAHWVEMLRANDDQAYRVYTQLEDKAGFDFFLKCDEPDGEVFTAVHESVHMIDAASSAYLLANGEKIPWTVDTIKTTPQAVADAPEVADNPYRDIYLRDTKSSSAQGLQGLLDELNAYSREMFAAARLAPKIERGEGTRVSNRDGVLSMMLFTKLYLSRVHGSAEWAELATTGNALAVRKLWAQAEASLVLGCQVPNLGIDDRKWLARVYAPEKTDGLTALIGHTPASPTGCE